MRTSRRDFLATGAVLAAGGTIGTLNTQARGADKFSHSAETVYKISPIGKIHNKKGSVISFL